MPQNFYELVWIFIIYAFIGWCTEVSYAALDRGFLCGNGSGNICKPRIFKRTILSNLWMRCCDRRCSPHSIERKSTDIVYRIVFIDLHSGIYHRIFT